MICVLQLSLILMVYEHSVQGSRIPISRHPWKVNFDEGESTYSRVNCPWESKKIALNKTGDHRGKLSILPSVMQFRIYRVVLKVCFHFGVVSLHSDDIHCYTITHYRSEWMKVFLISGTLTERAKTASETYNDFNKNVLVFESYFCNYCNML